MDLRAIRNRVAHLLRAHPAPTADARASAEAILAELGREIERHQSNPEPPRDLTEAELDEMIRQSPDDRILQMVVRMIRTQRSTEAQP
jgi:hypothetical protein